MLQLIYLALTFLFPEYDRNLKLPLSKTVCDIKPLNVLFSFSQVNKTTALQFICISMYSTDICCVPSMFMSFSSLPVSCFLSTSH